MLREVKLIFTHPTIRWERLQLPKMSVETKDDLETIYDRIQHALDGSRYSTELTVSGTRSSDEAVLIVINCEKYHDYDQYAGGIMLCHQAAANEPIPLSVSYPA